jgi:hypothetical protein
MGFRGKGWIKTTKIDALDDQEITIKKEGGKVPV